MAGNPKNTIITQNGVFDYGWLAKHNIIFRAKRQDTMVASHVIESDQPADLGSLVQRYLIQEVLNEAGINVKIDFTWKRTGPSQWIKDNKKWYRKEYGRDPHMGDVPHKMVVEYAKKDALYTLLIWYAIRGFLKKSTKFSYNLDMAMIPIVIGMKLRGIPIDLPLCRKRLKIARKQQKRFLNRFDIEKVGPLALRNVIFPSLKVKLRYKTEKGNWKFDEKTLRRYMVYYPEARKVLEQVIQYRKAKQSDSTYYSNYIKFSHRGRINPTFNITNARTGRFSSSGPNLQNVKKEGQERKVFLVRPGFIDLYWDYDQIELRILAHYSKEKRLLNIFKKGLDPHAMTAKLMGITKKTAKRALSGILRRMTPRDIGKNLNYSFWYGMGIDAFCLLLGISRSKGQMLFDRYRKTYPIAVSWSKEIQNEGRYQGYVEDIFGRQYFPDHFPGEKSPYYKLVNYLIQGTAAQVIKLGMLELQKNLFYNPEQVSIIQHISPNSTRAQQLLTVHDEICIEVKNEKQLTEEVITISKKALEITDIFKIPLTVGCKWTRTSWGDLHKLKEEPIPW